MRTIARVGGLVGKTVAIDEKTRFKPEYVRVKIACRNVELVPASAEGNLGMFIYDFFFHRELPEGVPIDPKKIHVSVDCNAPQPTPKKMRTDLPQNTSSSNAAKDTSSGMQKNLGGHTWKSQNDSKISLSLYS